MSAVYSGTIFTLHLILVIPILNCFIHVMTPLSRAYKKRKGMQLTINPTFEQKLKPQNGYTYYMYYSCTQKYTFPPHTLVFAHTLLHSLSLFIRLWYCILAMHRCHAADFMSSHLSLQVSGVRQKTLLMRTDLIYMNKFIFSVFAHACIVA